MLLYRNYAFPNEKRYVQSLWPGDEPQLRHKQEQRGRFRHQPAGAAQQGDGITGMLSLLTLRSLISWPVPPCELEIIPSTASVPNDSGKGGKTQKEGKAGTNHRSKSKATGYTPANTGRGKDLFSLSCPAWQGAGVAIPSHKLKK